MSGSAAFIGLPLVTGSLREECLGGLPGLILVLPGGLLAVEDGGFLQSMGWLGVSTSPDLLSGSGWIILYAFDYPESI